MTQYQLAEKLQQKLEFRIANPDRKRTASIHLVPPDRLLVRHHNFSYDPKVKSVSADQYQKLEDETGLDPQLQKDLTHCSLDSEVARLFYYSYRISAMANDAVESQGICDYVELAKSKLGPPAPTASFWTAKRARYKNRLSALRGKIEKSRERETHDERRKCLDNYSKYLIQWGL